MSLQKIEGMSLQKIETKSPTLALKMAEELACKGYRLLVSQG